MNATMLKALRVMATECRYGTTLTGNRRGLSERAKLKLLDAGLICVCEGNTGLYKVSREGWEAIEANKGPAAQ